jgi:hypothetical protein
MRKHDEYQAMRGQVWGHYINRLTGEVRWPFYNHNVIAYTAADIMARLLGGDQLYRPQYMGFIYGAAAAPTWPIPPGETPTSRVQTWAGLSTELADAGVTGNILITPLAAGPTYSVDGSTSYYSGNAVTLAAHTGSRLEYGFQTSAPYAGVLVDGNYFYQAMLLTRLVQGSTVTYLPFARVTLKDGTYPQKLVGYDLALFWQISYF